MHLSINSGAHLSILHNPILENLTNIALETVASRQMLRTKEKFRANHDSNNTHLPQMGAANTAYARSVPPLTIQPGALPDPGVVFDSIYARETYRPHPNNVSSVLFYWASIIIHGMF